MIFEVMIEKVMTTVRREDTETNTHHVHVDNSEEEELLEAL